MPWWGWGWLGVIECDLIWFERGGSFCVYALLLFIPLQIIDIQLSLQADHGLFACILNEQRHRHSRPFSFLSALGGGTTTSIVNFVIVTNTQQRQNVLHLHCLRSL